MAVRHIPELDGVRGIAILLVMLYHFRIFFPNFHGFEFGWCGVDLFFVLSGFLITGILIRSRESESYFRTFYLRRACRIMPLYYVAAILAVPLLTYQHRISSVIALSYWLHCSNLTTAFTPNVPLISHFWSLAIEEQFYLLWPLIVWLTPKEHLFKVCLGLAALSFGLRNLPWTLHHLVAFPEFAYRLTPFRIEPLLIGGALASRKFSAKVGLIGATTISIVALFAGTSATSAMMARFGFTGLALSFTGLIAWLPRWLKFSPLRLLGKYSYGLYVIHAPITGLVKHHIDGPLGFCLAWITSLLLALLSWHLLEKQFLKLKPSPVQLLVSAIPQLQCPCDRTPVVES